jgi:hypothetical protein
MANVGAAIGFGIVVAILCFVQGNIRAGLEMLGFTSFIAAIIFSRSASARLMVISMGMLVCSIAFAYSAVRCEITGKTVEYHGGRWGFAYARPITRQNSPETFRSCTNWRWALSIGFIGGGVVSFRFYRRLENEDWLS